MIITNKLKMDLERPGITPLIHAVQDDSYSRDLEIQLLSGGKPYPVPGDASVLVRYRKRDGKGGEYDTLPDGTPGWSAKGNLLTVRLAPQVLTVPGSVTVSISLLSPDAQLTLFPICLNVQPVSSAAIVESENYFYVTGFLSAPEKAREGQYIRVAAVSPDGRVERVEAVTLSGGGEVDPADIEQMVQDYLDQNPPEAGADGVSVTHKWSGTVLTLTSASGTSSADLKGSQGAPGEKGEKGESGVYILSEGETLEDAPEDADVVIDPEGVASSGASENVPYTYALTFTGGVEASYDGSAAVTVTIPEAVTDIHIRELIDSALAEIPNAAEVAY